MPKGLNAPIESGDIITESEFVRLRQEKFAALLNYNEHIERSLIFIEFDFQQERDFSKLLRDVLDVVCNAVVEYSHAIIDNADEENSISNKLRQSLDSKLNMCRRAFDEGAINDQQSEAVQALLGKVLRNVEGNREEL